MSHRNFKLEIDLDNPYFQAGPNPPLIALAEVLRNIAKSLENLHSWSPDESLKVALISKPPIEVSDIEDIVGGWSIEDSENSASMPYLSSSSTDGDFFLIPQESVQRYEVSFTKPDLKIVK